MRAKVTIYWHGYTETIYTDQPFKSKGKVAWITVEGRGELPYPYDELICERVE